MKSATSYDGRGGIGFLWSDWLENKIGLKPNANLSNYRILNNFAQRHYPNNIKGQIY